MSNINNKVSNLYEQFHKNTKQQNTIVGEGNFTYKILIKLLNQNLVNSKSVLDIGCGAGTLSFYLASKGFEVFGIDISEKAISVCKSSFEKLHFANTPIFKVCDFPNEKPNKKFDAVLCFEVLEHLKDDLFALNEISKLLNSRKILLISVPSKNAPLFKLGLAKKFDNDVGHLRRYSTEEIKKILIQSGFEIVNIQKNEGILRNFLFVNRYAGKFIRFIKGPISNLVTFVDSILMYLFGESDIILVARKST